VKEAAQQYPCSRPAVQNRRCTTHDAPARCSTSNMTPVVVPRSPQRGRTFWPCADKCTCGLPATAATGVLPRRVFACQHAHRVAAMPSASRNTTPNDGDSAEDVIAAGTGEQHGNSNARARSAISQCLNGRRVRLRLVQQVHHLFEPVDGARLDQDFLQITSKVRANAARIRQIRRIALRVHTIRKTNGEARDAPLRPGAPHHRNNRARIKATGEKCPHRHVRDELPVHGACDVFAKVPGNLGSRTRIHDSIVGRRVVQPMSLHPALLHDDGGTRSSFRTAANIVRAPCPQIRPASECRAMGSMLRDNPEAQMSALISEPNRKPDCGSAKYKGLTPSWSRARNSGARAPCRPAVLHRARHGSQKRILPFKRFSISSPSRSYRCKRTSGIRLSGEAVSRGRKPPCATPGNCRFPR